MRTVQPQKDCFGNDMECMDWNIAIGFVLGIVASGIAAIVYERATRPLLDVRLDDGPRALRQYPGIPPLEFYHLKVHNRSAIWPFPGRKPAWSCKGTIEVLGKDRVRVVPEPIHVRWTSQPEPLMPAIAGNQSVSIVDFARLIIAQKIDIHSHEDQQFSVALKSDGQPECYIFSNESYLYTSWANPAWRLGPGEYYLRVTIFYDRGRLIRSFTLKNLGTTRDSLKLGYVTD